MQKNCSVTLSNYMWDWLRTYKANEVKAASFDRLESTYNNHIKNSKIGLMPISLINTKDVQQFIDEGKSTQKRYEILNACFRHAVSISDLAFNPVEGVKLPAKDVNYRQIKQSNIFSSNEITKLIEEVDFTYKNGKKFIYSPIWLVILTTGISASEALALTWDKVDFENKKLKVNNSMSCIKNRTGEGNLRQNIMTQKPSRVIKLDNIALNALLEIKRRYNENGIITNFVICTESGAPHNLRNIQDAFKNLCKSARIKYRGIQALHNTYKVIESY